MNTWIVALFLTGCVSVCESRSRFVLVKSCEDVAQNHESAFALGLCAGEYHVGDCDSHNFHKLIPLRDLFNCGDEYIQLHLKSASKR